MKMDGKDWFKWQVWGIFWGILELLDLKIFLYMDSIFSFFKLNLFFNSFQGYEYKWMVQVIILRNILKFEWFWNCEISMD